MSENLSSRSGSMNPKPPPPMSFKVRILMAMTLVGFSILHLIGGIMIQRASGEAPIQAAMMAPIGD